MDSKDQAALRNALARGNSKSNHRRSKTAVLWKTNGEQNMPEQQEHHKFIKRGTSPYISDHEKIQARRRIQRFTGDSA